MTTNPVALKEWASAIRVLLDGDQIMLMRKGGIAEETKRFELKSHSFFLFPTYEHQRTDLVKEAYRPQVAQSLGDYPSHAETVCLTAYAEAVADLEIRDMGHLAMLGPYHMWTESLAAERLRWKAKEPLHVLLLRVHRLTEPLKLPMLPEYGGCRSWIELPQAAENVDCRPVLSDAEFDQRRREIYAALGQ